MNKNLRPAVLILGALVFSFLLFMLVWGKSLRIAEANRLLDNPAAPDGPAAARRIYEDLLVDLPHSPYLLHNLGLAHYRAGRTEEAVEHFHSACEELEKAVLHPERRRPLLYRFHYHRGSAWFAAAETASQGEATAAGYQKALADFKQAVKADPVDSDAKYNYELTLLRLEQAENENRQEKKEQPRARRQTGEEQDRQKTQDSRETAGNQETGEYKEDGRSMNAGAENQAGKEDEDTGMSKEEALTLLEMTESGALYQGPLLPEAPSSGKDW